jgi:putative tricarboxylic transport membrane protein
MTGQGQRLSGARWAAIAIIIGAAGLAFASTTIKYAFASDPLGPRTFPFVLGLGLALCGFWYLVQPGESEPPPNRKEFRNVVGFMALACLTVGLMPWIGFIVAMTMLCTGMALMFGASLPVSVISGLVQSLVWWALFGPLLGGNLPTGPLGF